MKVEIELISGEGLKVNGKPVKRRTFCVVTIEEKTKICNPDEFGGSNPIWREKIEMEMPINGTVKFISINVFYLTNGGAKKNIGYAKIPATDFIGGLSPLGHLNFLSYRLRDEYGDKSGIVNLSKLDGNQKVSSLWGCSSQAASVVAGNGQMWRPRISSSSMAVGVPVWCSPQR